MSIQTLLEQLRSALATRDRARINEAIEALIANPAKLGATWKSLASAASRNGEHGLALTAIERLRAEFPDDPYAMLEQAAFLIKAGLADRARALVERLPPGVPSAAERNYLLGTIALNQGRSEDARELLTAAATADPSLGQIWLALANCGAAGGSPEIGDAILAADTSVSSSRLDDRAQYLHARGKVLADRDEHRGAFRAFKEAGRLLVRARPFDLAAADANAKDLIERFNRALLEDIALPVSSKPSRPIFVTGMPRSGTTLVEQILSRSAEISGGGELGLFRLLHQDIGGGSPEAVRDFGDRRGLGPIANLYEHLLSERFPGGGHVIDKSLLAGNYMGLLLALFPDAPVVWMRRAPLDNAWSCFRTYFVAGLNWTNSLADIAGMMRLQEQLRHHWSAIAPGRILTVDLERLIDDSEVTIRAIAAHCRVEFVPEMLTPERGTGLVATASNLQVRTSINRKGIGAADPYLEDLKPFIDVYEAAQSV